MSSLIEYYFIFFLFFLTFIPGHLNNHPKNYKFIVPIKSMKKDYLFNCKFYKFTLYR